MRYGCGSTRELTISSLDSLFVQSKKVAARLRSSRRAARARLPLAAIAAGLLSIAATCPMGDNGYRGPVSVDHLQPFPLGECAVSVAQVHNGPRSPEAVKNLTATCENPQVCRAEVRERGVIVVFGNSPGATMLRVRYDHPRTLAHEEKALPVQIEAPAGTAPPSTCRGSILVTPDGSPVPLARP
jgi:hypothetical protein